MRPRSQTPTGGPMSDALRRYRLARALLRFDRKYGLETRMDALCDKLAVIYGRGE